MTRHRFFLALSGLALSADASAQTRTREPERTDSRPKVQTYSSTTRADDRPYIGISTGTSGRRDTLGLLVTDVVADGPAARAGVDEGDRLQAVNGISLRLSAADAGESDMDGVALRRLTRELAKGKVGDEVELRVYRDGQSRVVRAKTVSSADLREERGLLTREREAWGDRASLGIGLGASGSRRDTAGILVASVDDDGPADKARVEEGDRIASINGVDLRVAREDAGDPNASMSRMRRLTREMQKAKAGDEVELRLIRSGQSRTVRVKTVAARDLPRGEGSGLFFGGQGAMLDGLREGLEALPRMIPRIDGGRALHFDGSEGGPIRMRIDPGARLEIDESLRDALGRARGSLLRIRPRSQADAESSGGAAAEARPGRSIVRVARQRVA